MRVVAIDPGGTNGFAVFDTTTAKFVRVGEVAGWQFLNTFVELLDQGCDIVVIENFVMFPGSRLAPDARSTLQMIGAVHALCWSRGVPIKFQSPQIARTIGLRFRHQSDSPHIRSAMAHAVYRAEVNIRTAGVTKPIVVAG